MKNNKYFYILSIIGTLLVIAIAVGSSYAFFTNTKIHSTATVITSGDLKLELNDGNVIGTPKEMIPGNSIVKQFSVKNTGSKAVAYDIYLSEILNDFADKSDLVYSISSSDGGYNSSSDAEVPSEVGLQSKIIDSYVIGAGETQSYELTIKFLSKNKNQDNNKGKTFSAKIQINDYKNYTIAILKPGRTVSGVFETLAGSSYNINYLEKATTLDENANKEIVSTDDSTTPVYVWYDSNSNTLYYYSEASKIYLNENSECLFEKLGIRSFNIKDFDSSHVTNMDYMFLDCYYLSDLDLSGFDTSNVKSMERMFYYCSGLVNLDLSSFNTSNLENMEHMFEECYNLVNLNLSSFDTSNVTNMYGTFSDCSKLVTLDISVFDTSNVTNMWHIFEDCTSLRTIYVGEYWDTDSIQSNTPMFRNDTNLVGRAGTTFDSNHTEVDYAHVDNAVRPGYLSFKHNPNCPFKYDGRVVIRFMTGDEGRVSQTIYRNLNTTLGNFDEPEIFFDELAFDGWYFDKAHQEPIDSSYAISSQEFGEWNYILKIYAKYKIAYINENGYNYYSDSDWMGYAVEGQTTIYPKSRRLVKQANNNGTDYALYIRKKYVDGECVRNDPCGYQNGREYCVNSNFWVETIGSTSYSSQDLETVKAAFKADIEAAFEGTEKEMTVNCRTSTYSGGSAYVTCDADYFDGTYNVGLEYVIQNKGFASADAGYPTQCSVWADGKIICSMNW